MRRLVALLLMGCILFAAVPVQAQGIGWGGAFGTWEGEPLREFAVRALSPTSIRIEWGGRTGWQTSVSIAVQGPHRGVDYTGVSSGYIIENLAPGTTYTVTLHNVNENDGSLKATITMPATEAFTEFDFRAQNCEVHHISATWIGASSAPPDILDQQHEPVQKISASELRENLTNSIYAMILTIRWKPTEEAKMLREMWVMRTPDGDVFTQSSTSTLDGSWWGADQYYWLNDMFKSYLDGQQDLTPGIYLFEIYFNEKLAGKAALKVEA